MSLEGILTGVSFLGVMAILLALILFATKVLPLLRAAMDFVSVLNRVFVTKGDKPMDARHYAAYRRTKYVGSLLAEEVFLSRLLVVETAPGVQRAIYDVSSRGQFTFLLEHMRNHPSIGDDERIVIDLGANDGLQGSHSFNFTQLGWWTVLVEANPQLEAEIRDNTARGGRWLGHEDRVIIRMSAVTSGQDGPCTLHVQGWRHTGSSLNENPEATGRFEVQTQAESVDTLMQATERALVSRGATLPRTFGVLSIDIEGCDLEVLTRICGAGFRPRYIVSEEREDLSRYDRLLHPLGYQRIGYFDADVIYWLDPARGSAPDDGGAPFRDQRFSHQRSQGTVRRAGAAGVARAYKRCVPVPPQPGGCATA